MPKTAHNAFVIFMPKLQKLDFLGMVFPCRKQLEEEKRKNLQKAGLH
jgi:hypothetical protein